MTVGSAQSVLDASAATTSSELRGWRSHRTCMTWASASLMGMSFTTVIFNDYTRKQTGCQAIHNPPAGRGYAPTPRAPAGRERKSGEEGQRVSGPGGLDGWGEYQKKRKMM